MHFYLNLTYFNRVAHVASRHDVVNKQHSLLTKDVLFSQMLPVIRAKIYHHGIGVFVWRSAGAFGIFSLVFFDNTSFANKLETDFESARANILSARYTVSRPTKCIVGILGFLCIWWSGYLWRLKLDPASRGSFQLSPNEKILKHIATIPLLTGYKQTNEEQTNTLTENKKNFY